MDMPELSSFISDKQRQELRPDAPIPLYYQLYKLLKALIVEGTLLDGTQMPTEQQLSNEFGISRITSKRALDELAMEDLVQRQRGKGTYVTHKLRNLPLHSPMVGLLQEIESIGKDTTAMVLDSGFLQPPLEVRDILGLEAGQLAVFLARVRQQNGRRFGYYRSWTTGVELPPDLRVFERTPRMTQFREQGLEVRFIKQKISAQGAPPEVAEALGVHIGSPLLSLVRLSYREKDSLAHPVDYLKVLYHPARFEYQIDLELEAIT